MDRIISVKGSLSREECLDAIKMTLIRFNAYMQEFDSQHYYSPGKFTAEQRDFLYAIADRRYLENMNAVLVRKQLERLDNASLEKILDKCRRLSDGFRLYVDIPKGARIADGGEGHEPDTYRKAEDKNDKSENMYQIRYFLERYQNLSNWTYDGQGCFIAKKNATLWELGGKYWNKLFELPQNPNLIHIGDRIKLKKEVIDIIYEHSISDITGGYSVEPSFPNAKDLIYGIISLCAGASSKIPKTVKYGFMAEDIRNAYDTITSSEKTASELSYFIQQYSTEGQEEDAWKKFIAITSLLGSVFSALGLLATASGEENKYQIVQYNQRKAFINSAEYEIKRIAMIKKTAKENELQTEIAYIRFLEKQIVMLNEEIRLNKKHEDQQKAEILRSFATLNTHGAVYKDDRIEKSPESYHRIDYHTLFAEKKK